MSWANSFGIRHKSANPVARSGRYCDHHGGSLSRRHDRRVTAARRHNRSPHPATFIAAARSPVGERRRLGGRSRCDGARRFKDDQVPTASSTHFLTWLFFAAPASFLASESAEQVFSASL